MQTNCTIPGCVNNGRYCRLHSGSLAPSKEPKPINKKSEKRKEIDNKEYLPAARKFIKDNPNCELKMKGCTGRAQGVHHLKGKATIELLLDKRFWKASCYHCNLMAEIKDAEARASGLKLSKFN